MPKIASTRSHGAADNTQTHVCCSYTGSNPLRVQEFHHDCIDFFLYEKNESLETIYCAHQTFILTQNYMEIVCS